MPGLHRSRARAPGGRASRSLGFLLLALALGLLPGFGFLVAGAAAAGEEPGPVAAEEPARLPARTRRDRIRVASFNVAWFSGHEGRGFVPRSEADLGYVARVVRGTHAHLICLQEVVDEEALAGLVARMNRLAQGEAEYSYRLEDGSPVFWPGARAMGQQVAFVHDRKRIRLTEAEPFQGEEAEDFIRPPVRVAVEVRGTSLRFDAVGVHLKSGALSERDSAIRGREVEALLAWLDRRRREEPRVLLLGDFNAPRDHESLEALDARADAGELVAIEDHYRGVPTGTHIPWGVQIDRALMTASLWEEAGVHEGASVFRYEQFMPRSRQKEFCIRSRWPVRDEARRCDCEALVDEEAAAAAAAEEQLEAELAREELDEECPACRLPFLCQGSPKMWVKIENYLRVSDHRPVLWDLRTRARRSRRRYRRGR